MQPCLWKPQIKSQPIATWGTSSPTFPAGTTRSSRNTAPSVSLSLCSRGASQTHSRPLSTFLLHLLSACPSVPSWDQPVTEASA